MDVEVKRWIAGLLFASVVGGIVVRLFLYSVRRMLGLGEKPKKDIKRVYPWLTGAVERLAFTVFIGLELPDATTAMMAWLALKLAANWGRPDMDKDPATHSFSFTALLAGLISMVFAALGGMIASGKLWSAFVENI
jgi:hypothetical protein